MGLSDESIQKKSQITFAKDTIITDSGEVLKIGAFFSDENTTRPRFSETPLSYSLFGLKSKQVYLTIQELPNNDAETNYFAACSQFKAIMF